MSDKSKKDMDIGRKIWLAGIGAYGKALGDAQEAYARVGKETTKVFEELVSKGTALETQMSDAATKLVPEIAKNAQKQRAQVEDRMERMKTALGLTEAAVDNQEHIEAIEGRLDVLEAKLDEILALLKPSKSTTKPKTPTKARSTRKTSGKTAVKTTATTRKKKSS